MAEPLRIEKIARELSAIREQIKSLEAAKDDLNRRMILLLKNEATVDDEGKLRLVTPTAKFVLIQSSREYCDVKKLGTALLGQGMAPAAIEKVKAVCVTTSSSEWVGVYPIPQAVPEAKAKTGEEKAS